MILCSGGHHKQHLYYPSSHLGFFNLQEGINFGKFLKSDQFQSSGLTSVAIQFHRLIYRPLIELIMATAYDHQNSWCHATPVWRRCTFLLILFEKIIQKTASALLLQAGQEVGRCKQEIFFREAPFSENLSKGTFYIDRIIVANATPKC